MRIIKLKNPQAISDVWYGLTVDAGEYSDIISEIDRLGLLISAKVNQDIWSTPAKLVISDGGNDLSAADGDSWLKGSEVAQPNTEKRHYIEVGAGNTITSDYVVPDGQTLTLSEIGGSAVGNSAVLVCIIWDPDGTPELLLSTTHDSVQSTLHIFNGNGSKKMQIKLINEDSIAHTIGAYYIGEVK